MNTQQNGTMVLTGHELEQINGGIQYGGGNGEIFSSGLEMVAEGKEMMKSGGTISGFFGLAQTTVGGWYLVIGGIADWFGRW